MTEILEIPPLLVKDRGKTINLTFENGILSIAEKKIPSRNILDVKLKNSSSNKFNNLVSVEINVLSPFSGGKKLRLTNFTLEATTAEQATSWAKSVRDVAYK
ncbi:6064_t:CDS:2, partial [Diversispora eburnea]